MYRQLTPFFVFIAIFLLLSSLVYAVYGAQHAWVQKVDPWVLETAAGQETEFLLYLSEQADLSGARTLPTKLEKGIYVYEQLTAVARRTQPAVIAALQAEGVAYRPYWVANMIWVRGDAAVVQAIAQRSDVAHIYANPKVPLERPPQAEADERVSTPQSVVWNINLVGAPQVWEAGYTGQGVVIGGQDTGYDWNHAALKNQYRGWDGETAVHDYNWHDAIHENNPSTSPGNVCGFDAPAPCDDNNHGTHTMGTMVGNDLPPTDPGWPAAATNAVGMAPGAQWIACRNMEEGWGSPASYSECYQWFIAPYPIGGDPFTDGDPAKAPHVINNSWSCPTVEGCTDPEALLAVVENVRAAGIVTVHSAGNSGSACSTINAPSAIYDASFTVGATTSTDAIASFSSRGPVTVDGSNRLKPDVVAPGVNIRSTIDGGSYAIFQGTSMAGPHVAGLVALLISARPELAGQVDEIESIIGQTAVAKISSQGCGGMVDTAVPNHVYGYGRIDVPAAVEKSLPPSSLLYVPIVTKK